MTSSAAPSASLSAAPVDPPRTRSAALASGRVESLDVESLAALLRGTRSVRVLRPRSTVRFGWVDAVEIVAGRLVVAYEFGTRSGGAAGAVESLGASTVLLDRDPVFEVAGRLVRLSPVEEAPADEVEEAPPLVVGSLVSAVALAGLVGSVVEIVDGSGSVVEAVEIVDVPFVGVGRRRVRSGSVLVRRVDGSEVFAPRGATVRPVEAPPVAEVETVEEVDAVEADRVEDPDPFGRVERRRSLVGSDLLRSEFVGRRVEIGRDGRLPLAGLLVAADLRPVSGAVRVLVETRSGLVRVPVSPLAPVSVVDLVSAS